MGLEIERKFLVVGDFVKDVSARTHIVQGYLCSVPERTVRVRIADDRGVLTIKGAAAASGMSRFEWERDITVDDARDLLQLCEPGVIDKIRHRVPVGAHVYEVDVFAGENEGLILAEIELASEGEAFERPTWLGDEVTGDARYYNAALVRHPYCRW